jgi:hypothetical protein
MLGIRRLRSPVGTLASRSSAALDFDEEKLELNGYYWHL